MLLAAGYQQSVLKDKANPKIPPLIMFVPLKCEKYYNENSMFALKNKSFHLAELGNDAGIYGAVRMVLFK